MAQRKIQMDQEKLCCSICLDLLKDPVTIPCGHSYCMNCIKLCWDEEDQKEIHSCPQCRQTFRPRPALVKTTMLVDLVEELKKTRLQAAPDDHCYAGPDDVSCDVCTGRKQKATKSCLQCLVSYCEQHLQPHYESPAFEKHKLVDPSKKLQDNICSNHDEVMKISQASRSEDFLRRRPEPKTRADFLEYSRHITLDPNTAHTQLLLFEGNRKATVTEEQSYPQHPDRFTERQQVMSRESLAGRCYWEVEWSGCNVVAAVIYKDIRKTGSESDFGLNDRSWALRCYSNCSEFLHDNISTSGPSRQSSRIGVYLDHSAGILSFYSISETMTLLHRVQTTFTQSLYAGFAIYGFDNTLELCEIK